MATTTAVVLSPNAKPERVTQQAPLSVGSTHARKHRSSNVFWIKLNFTVKAARLQSLKRHKYQHLQEEALLKARGLLKNWEDGPVLLIEDLYRQATSAASGGDTDDAHELRNYTPEALALRFSLRNDPAVLSAVKELWTIDTGPRDALGCIDRRAYTALFRRIAKCVDAEAFPKATRQPVPKRMEQMIHEDWTRDSKGEAQMSFANFFDSVFELADLWCETIHVDDYVHFLRRVRDRISERKTKTKAKKTTRTSSSDKRVLRPMKKVRPLDADDSEEDSDDSETSTSEGSDEVADTKEEELQTGPAPPALSFEASGGAGDGFAHSSMVHRFLTAKSLGVKSPAASYQVVSPARKIHSATSSLGSQQPQHHHQQDVAGRFVAIAHQQQLVERQSFNAQQQRQERRPSDVTTTLRFDDGGSGRIALVTNDTGSNSNGNGNGNGNLSALVAGGTTFLPATAVGSRGNSLSQMQPIQENSAGLVLKKASGDIVAEARPRTPIIAVHVVESGLDRIINSSNVKQAAAGELGPEHTEASVPKPSVTKADFAAATRHAVLSLARTPNRNPLVAPGGFRDVVFNAMHGISGSSQMASAVAGHSDASNFGSIVGSQLHAATAAPAMEAPTATMSVGYVNSGRSSTPASRSRLVSRQPSPGLPVKVPIASSRGTVAQQGETDGKHSQPESSYHRSSYSNAAPTPAATSTPSPLLKRRPSGSTTPVNPRARPSEVALQQQKKRGLPPMSPATQLQPRASPYRLTHDDGDTGADDTVVANNNYNLSEPVDLSTSYRTTSYAMDPSARTNSSNSTMRASANGSSSLSALDPYTKSAASAAPLWYGLRSTKEPRSGKTVSKRVRTPSPAMTTTSPVRSHRVDVRHSGGAKGQLKGQSDDLDSLHASPWDTYEDDDAFDSDFLLGRDWQSFSLVDGASTAAAVAAHDSKSSLTLSSGFSLSPTSRNKQSRQQQKTIPQQQVHNVATISKPKVERNTKSYAAVPSLIVTSLGSSSPAKLSHSFSAPETGNYDPSSSSSLLASASASSISRSDATRSVGTTHLEQLPLLPAAPVREIEQLLISKSPLHQDDPLPRNASREKGVAGWRDGLVSTVDAHLELRGERSTSVCLNSVSLEPDSVGLSRPMSPIRSRGYSRSEKHSEDCTLDHCEAAARIRSLESTPSSLYDVERSKSPVFKMEKRRATVGINEENAELSDHSRTNRELLDDVTILLNARRELILQPKQNETGDGIAKLYTSTRSEMMKRRFKYTFGRT